MCGSSFCFFLMLRVSQTDTCPRAVTMWFSSRAVVQSGLMCFRFLSDSRAQRSRVALCALAFSLSHSRSCARALTLCFALSLSAFSLSPVLVGGLSSCLSVGLPACLLACSPVCQSVMLSVCLAVSLASPPLPQVQQVQVTRLHARKHVCAFLEVHAC